MVFSKYWALFLVVCNNEFSRTLVGKRVKASRCQDKYCGSNERPRRPSHRLMASVVLTFEACASDCCLLRKCSSTSFMAWYWPNYHPRIIRDMPWKNFPNKRLWILLLQIRLHRQKSHGRGGSQRGRDISVAWIPLEQYHFFLACSTYWMPIPVE